MAFGKLAPFLIFLIAVEFSLMLFIGVNTPALDLLTLVSNPENWTIDGLINRIGGVIAAVGVIGILIGTFVGGKTDFLIFGGFTTLFLSYGKVLAQLSANIAALKDVSTAGTLIAFLITAPIIIIYIYTVLKFWRATD